MALRILARDAAAVAREAGEDPFHRRMRLFIAVRTRFAEDALAAAVNRGVRQQLVVLGAGLDTYAYRGALRDRLRIFEVDHPDTQAWKRRRLAEVGIEVPDSLTFAGVDFESEGLAEGLKTAGFDPSQLTFFFWLGVVPYLTEAAVYATMSFIAGLPGGAHVVFDYADPPGTLPPELRENHDRRAAYLAGLGEAWLSYFEPHELDARLTGLGFREIEDLGPRQIAARYFPGWANPARDRGGHVIRATTLPASSR